MGLGEYQPGARNGAHIRARITGRAAGTVWLDARLVDSPRGFGTPCPLQHSFTRLEARKSYR